MVVLKRSDWVVRGLEQTGNEADLLERYRQAP